MKSSILSLAVFVLIFAFAAKLSLAARHGPLELHTDGKELLSGTSNCKVETDFICKGKSSWPELVGVNGEVAAVIIEKENPYVHAIVILEGTPVIQNFSCARVWVVVDDDEKVVAVPVIG